MTATLSGNFALVRPVGMDAKETAEWLNVATDALVHIPFHIFEPAALAARLTCTHHSQIVPKIVEMTREAVAWHNRRPNAPMLQLVHEKTECSNEALPDPATLSPTLLRMGLSKGWIIDRDGRLEWAEDNAA